MSSFLHHFPGHSHAMGQAFPLENWPETQSPEVDRNQSSILFPQHNDPLTQGPDPNSKLLGRAQGLYGSARQSELCLLMAMNFAFTDGTYNGSSISLLGKNSAMSSVHEMPIVGRTGLFRLARGYAIAKTHWFDITTGDAIVGYNITVVH
ncbi:hypothetical protein GH714_030708 [Hevea brasiliensis]|uniref:Dirigent protein n=1 Tax=Hevea brasiliensis TaxID=3981 RepID=A0A6A6NBT3_HEVBR|nr:hypothetical protein GH714_030708 [Hevea brasiliensis]